MATFTLTDLEIGEIIELNCVVSTGTRRIRVKVDKRRYTFVHHQGNCYNKVVFDTTSLEDGRRISFWINCRNKLHTTKGPKIVDYDIIGIL